MSVSASILPLGILSQHLSYSLQTELAEPPDVTRNYTSDYGSTFIFWHRTVLSSCSYSQSAHIGHISDHDKAESSYSTVVFKKN